MKKLTAVIMIVFVMLLTTFATWQLFMGNLEAAFSPVPFLLITYLFVIRRNPT